MFTAIFHSLIIAVFATLIGFFLMLPLTYKAATKAFRGKWLLETVLLLPLVLPPTVVGFYLLLLLGRYGWIGALLNKVNFSLIFTLTGAVIASTIVTLPLVYQGLKGAIQSVPRALIDVASTLSASPREILFRVILPNCWPAVAASLLLSFCRALGEFGASLMVAGYIQGKTDTIANSIYFAVQNGDNTRAILLSLINVAFSLVVLSLIYLLTKKRRAFDGT
jgi:molybdate transport system permease protein